jgi:PAS domain S-box-containing protein
MSTDAAAHDSSLRIARKKGEKEELKIFCGHCGRPPEREAEDQASRVCAKCGMGLLLQAPIDTAPTPKDPFLVVDGALTICALSRQAEKLLGVSETEAVNRHVADFLVPADSEEKSGSNLATLLVWAARGETPMGNVVVRPANTFGVRYWARVGPCGPPSAALLVLADAR